MDSPSSRSLQLLAMLQTGRSWSAAELAARLGVAPRTIRRDIARLRELGYDVPATPGPGGAYRLAPGIRMPPLLLDADEVCSLVTALLVLEAGVDDGSAATVRVKLEQLLPPSLRRRALATAMATRVLPTGLPAADWGMLGTLADIVADGDRLAFAYTDQRGIESTREVDPYRHVLRDGRWYLVAYDHGREDWRLFRVDRIRDPTARRAPADSAHAPFPHESIEGWLATDFGRRADRAS